MDADGQVMSRKRKADTCSWCDSNDSEDLVVCGYIWTIDNFLSMVSKNTRYIKRLKITEGDDLTAESNKEIIWNIFVKHDHEGINCYQHVTEKNYYEYNAAFTLLSAFNLKTEHNLNAPPNNATWKMIVDLDTIHRDAAFLMSNGRLSFLCELFVKDGSSNKMKRTYNASRKQFKLSEDFGGLFERATNADVTICLGGNEIKAHKAILTARSTVFAKMFSNGTLENTMNVVKIADIEYDVFSEMLRYIYTGVLSLTEIRDQRMAIKLFEASDKYYLPELSDICAKTLSDHLTIDNVCEIFLLGDRHSHIPLQDQAIKFIKANTLTVIMETEGFKALFAEEGIDLLKKLIKTLESGHNFQA